MSKDNWELIENPGNNVYFFKNPKFSTEKTFSGADFAPTSKQSEVIRTLENLCWRNSRKQIQNPKLMRKQSEISNSLYLKVFRNASRILGLY